MKVYFDNAATTKVREEAIDAMVRVMRDDYGNPSSTHYAGRYAATVLSGARGKIAAALGAMPDEIVFTSGGTESDNLAILGCAGTASHNGKPRSGKHIITSGIEHDAVLEATKHLEGLGWDVTYLLPDSSGRVSADSFSGALRDDTVLASIMLVNNETGAVNPVNEYAREIKRRRLSTILHTDAVQGFCKIPFTVDTLGADLVSVSAHKIHGPKGIGALYIKKGAKLQPMLHGGGQEQGKRAGTEAIPAIAGFGEAAYCANLERETTYEAARALERHIFDLVSRELPDAVFLRVGGESPYIINLSLPGYKSEVLMNALEADGICVSNSAACKKGARSRVLEAMGLSDDIIDGALRVSLSRYNTREEAEYFVKALEKAASRLVKIKRNKADGVNAEKR